MRKESSESDLNWKISHSLILFLKGRLNLFKTDKPVISFTDGPVVYENLVFVFCFPIGAFEA